MDSEFQSFRIGLIVVDARLPTALANSLHLLIVKILDFAFCLKISLGIPEKLGKFALSCGIYLMYETYDAHGITFQYPAEWEVNEQMGEGEVLITVSSPETSFWSISLFADRPTLEAVVNTAISAFREEYDDLDVYEAYASLCGRQTLARDLEFFCLELLNSAWIRAFTTPDFTALILFQANDLELTVSEPLFKRMSQSLTCNGAGLGDLGERWS